MEKKKSTKQTETTVESFAQKLLQLSEKEDFRSLLEEDDLIDEAIAEVLELELEREGSFEQLGNFLIAAEEDFLSIFHAKLEEATHPPTQIGPGMPPPDHAPPGQGKEEFGGEKPSDYSIPVEYIPPKPKGQQGVLFEEAISEVPIIHPDAFSKKKQQGNVPVVALNQRSRELVRVKPTNQASATFKVCFAGTLEYSSSHLRERAWLEFLQEMQLLISEDAVVSIPDTCFKKGEHATTLMPFSAECHKNHWENTLSLFSRFSSSAIAGKIFMWRLSDKEAEVVEQVILEGSKDRSMANAYYFGKYWAYQPGKEACALRIFDAVIRRAQGHASAYERRGYTNFKLRNYDQALMDFNKSIEINSYQIDSFFGRAVTLINLGNMEAAIKDLNFVKGKSMEFQIIHWTARLLKGQCHLILGEYDFAESELEPCAKKFFDAANDCFLWQRASLVCKVIFELRNHNRSGALKILREAMEFSNHILNQDGWFEIVQEEYAMLAIDQNDGGQRLEKIQSESLQRSLNDLQENFGSHHQQIANDLYMETERIENKSSFDLAPLVKIKSIFASSDGWGVKDDLAHLVKVKRASH